MGIDRSAFKIVLLLHLLSVIAGFGPVVLNGLYGAAARRRKGPEGAAITRANYDVSNVAEKIIYLVPVFGFAAVGLSDKAYRFSQTWVWLSLLLWVVGVGVAHAVMIPTHKRMIEVAEAGGGPEAADLEKRLAAGGGFLNILLVVIIVLMIWKPGL